MTIKGRTKRASMLNNPEYLRDLLRLPARTIRAKWGVSRNAVYNHLHMSGAEIRRRIEEADHE